MPHLRGWLVLSASARAYQKVKLKGHFPGESEMMWVCVVGEDLGICTQCINCTREHQSLLAKMQSRCIRKRMQARHRDTTGPADDFDYLGRIKKKLAETSQCFGRKLTRGEISQRLNKGRRLIHQCHRPQIARHKYNFNALDIIRIKGRWGIGRAIIDNHIIEIYHRFSS